MKVSKTFALISILFIASTWFIAFEGGKRLGHKEGFKKCMNQSAREMNNLPN